MNNQDKDKKEYELALLLKSEGDMAGVLVLVGQHNGEISAEPKMKNLALAYEIKGHKEAVFAYCNFKAFGEDAKELERDLTSRQDVIRSMIIASPPAAEKITPPGMPRERRGKMSRMAPIDAKPAAPRPLSNEALEKKIEEILQ